MKRIILGLFIVGIALIVFGLIIDAMLPNQYIIALVLLLTSIVLGIKYKQGLISVLSAVIIVLFFFYAYLFFYYDIGTTEPGPIDIEVQDDDDLIEQDIERSPLEVDLMPIKWYISNDILHIHSDIMLDGVMTGTYYYSARLVSGNRTVCIGEGSRILYLNEDMTGFIRAEFPCPDYDDGILEVSVGKDDMVNASIEVVMDSILRSVFLNNE